MFAKLVARNLGVEGAECDSKGLKRGQRPLEVHRKLILAHASKLKQHSDEG